MAYLRKCGADRGLNAKVGTAGRQGVDPTLSFSDIGSRSAKESYPPISTTAGHSIFFLSCRRRTNSPRASRRCRPDIKILTNMAPMPLGKQNQSPTSSRGLCRQRFLQAFKGMHSTTVDRVLACSFSLFEATRRPGWLDGKHRSPARFSQSVRLAWPDQGVLRLSGLHLHFCVTQFTTVCSPSAAWSRSAPALLVPPRTGTIDRLDWPAQR